MQTITEAVDLQAMLAGYLECVLWASIDDNGTPLDENYFETDIHPDCQAAEYERCRDFIGLCLSEGIDFEALHMESSSIGHDFWLTRNGHGAGFWDRGLGEVGEHLTRIAKTFGSSDAYAGDDGKVYLS